MQNQTKSKISNTVKPYKAAQFDAYITWRALGGLVIDEDDTGSPNKIKIMPLAEFCTTFGVHRNTIWAWKTQTPNLAELIEKRREEVVPLARLSAAWNQLFMLGMQSQDKRAAVDALKTYIGHYGNLRLPTQRQEVEAGDNLSKLINLARNKKIIEAEVIDDTRTSSSAN